MSDVNDRVKLAKWIVSRENPLTARVIVNQVWQLFFGAGLVRTPGDFGSQGEMPTPPPVVGLVGGRFHGTWLGPQTPCQANR